MTGEGGGKKRWRASEAGAGRDESIEKVTDRGRSQRFGRVDDVVQVGRMALLRDRSVVLLTL